jgi:hypothetical protein
VLVLARSSTLVRVVRDRGQWFIEISASVWDDWFAPLVWHSVLNETMPASEARPFTSQAALVLEDLDEIEALTRTAGDAVRRRLKKRRTRRAEARRQLPPEL